MIPNPDRDRSLCPPADARALAEGPTPWQLRQAVDTAGEVIFMTDRTGVITFVNRAFERLYGYSADEVVGQATPRLLKSNQVHPDDYASFWEALLRGETIRREFENRTRLGATVSVEATVNPVFDEQHALVGFLAVQRDITDRKKAEKALRESEVRYSLLAEASRDQIFIIDPEGRLQYVNAYAARKLGGRPDELMGRLLSDWFPAETVEAQRREVARAIRSRSAVHGELHAVFDGTTVWLSTWLVPIVDDDGEIRQVLGVARDISEQRRLAMLLERQNHLLAAVIHQSPVGISILNESDFVHELVNPAVERLAPGVSLPGTPFAAAWPSFSERILPVLRRVMSTGVSEEVTDLEFWVPGETDAAGAGRFLEISIARVQLPTRAAPSLLLATRETTEHKQLVAQFHHAQKMEAIGRLAGGIAHDFNNLLTSVLGYAELVINALPPDSPFQSDLGEVRRAAQSAAALTRQLLTFSRKRSIDHQVVDINAVIKGFTRILSRTIGEDIRLEIDLESAPWRVMADPGQLEQVLMNLCVNARDAMPDGGRLAIRTNNVMLREPGRAARRHIPPGAYLMLSVADTGTGMTAETQAHLFEPFYTTKEFGRGTGLGLSTVYGVVKESRGYMAVMSEPGRGTTFSIYLPRMVERQVQAAPAFEAVDVRGSGTVLVVEDSEGLLSLTARLLTDLGYTALSAGSAREALEVSDAFDGRIDLLLTDIVMPGGDGFALASALGRRRAGISVLYMSGYADRIAVRYQIDEADIALMRKPFDRQTLGLRVREALSVRPQP